jgi:hypothetical protein
MSACLAISSESSTQPDVIGDAQITTTVCYNGGPSPPLCSSPSNTGGASPNTMLLAYRVQEGVGVPSQVKTASGDAYTFNWDQSYTDSLTQTAPPPAGERWAGYRVNSGPAFGGSFGFTVRPRFSLPPGADGTPFHGPFTYRGVVGWANTSSTSALIVCNSSDPTTSSGGPNPVECIDSPQGPTTYQSDKQLATRELGIKGPDTVSVRAGEGAVVPATAEFAGPAGPSFEVFAETDAPDTTAVPSITSMTPASDSTTPVNVRLSVDPTTPLGTYKLTVRARVDSGAQRTRAINLVVTLGKPASLIPPAVTGTGAVGQTLTCLPGRWTGGPQFAYQWTRGGAPIAGATSSTYTVTQEDGALLVGCTVTASNTVGATSAITPHLRIAQEGGADVNLKGTAGATTDGTGLYLVDQGITVSCPARLPQNCGLSNTMTTTVDTAGAAAHRSAFHTLKVGSAGLTALSGQKLRLRIHLTHAGTKLLEKLGKLTISAEVTTRNHALERVVSRKQFTIRRPR